MREFIPGPCGMGSSEEIELFEQADRPDQSEAVVAAAKKICEGCVQFDYCESQRQDIGTELVKRGAAKPIVAGEQVEATIKQRPQQPSVRLNALREPAFTFNIYALPADISPHGLLQVIRQAFRSRQLPRRLGKTLVARDHMITELSAVPVPAELPDPDRKQALTAAAGMFLKYAKRKPKNYDPLQRNTEERSWSQVCYAEFLQDAVELSRAGGPMGFLKYHEATLYQAIIKAAVSPGGITQGMARYMIHNSEFDPISRLRERQKTLTSANRLELPEALKNSTRTFIKAETDAVAQLDGFGERFTELSDAFPTVSDMARRHIAHVFKIGHIEAMNTYIAAYNKLSETYKDEPLIPVALLSKAICQNVFNPEPFVATWLERSHAAREIARKHGFPYTDNKIARITFDRPGLTSAEELQRTLLSSIARGLQKTRPLVELEDLISITIAYPEKQEYHRAATCLSNLLQRKLIQKDGGEWVWTADADYLTDSERQAVLSATKLDKFIDGTAYDRQALQEILGTEDIDSLVQDILVPYLLPVSKRDLLSWIRYRAHNNEQHSRHFVFDQKELEILEQDFAPHVTGDLHTKHRANAARCLKQRLLEAYTEKELAKLLGTDRLSSAIREYLEDCATLPKTLALARLPRGTLERVIAYDDGTPVALTNAPKTAILIANEPLKRFREIKRTMQLLVEAALRRQLSPSQIGQAAIRYTPQEIPRFIENITRITRQYYSHSWASNAGVLDFCIRAGLEDPQALIEERIKIAQHAYSAYGNRIERETIIAQSFSRTSPFKYFERTIKRMDALQQAYGHRDDVDDYVFYRAAESAHPEKWMKAYLRRYENACTLATVKDSPAVLRRIVATNIKPDAVRWAIAGYEKLRLAYEVDAYIVPSMVDAAVKWDFVGAKLALRRLRDLLASGSLGVQYVEEPTDKAERRAYLQQQTQTEMASAEATFFGQDEQQTENPLHRTIASVLQNVSKLEKAAVLHVYGLPWLIDEGDDDYTDPMVVSTLLGLKDPSEIYAYVTESVIPKISPTN